MNIKLHIQKKKFNQGDRFVHSDIKRGVPPVWSLDTLHKPLKVKGGE